MAVHVAMVDDFLETTLPIVGIDTMVGLFSPVSRVVGRRVYKKQTTPPVRKRQHGEGDMERIMQYRKKSVTCGTAVETLSLSLKVLSVLDPTLIVPC